ncbi:hypothetical protein [Streptomyces sp. NPDC002587]
MITSAAGQPLIPQPPSTVTALRQAVAQISPAALPAHAALTAHLP